MSREAEKANGVSVGDRVEVKDDDDTDDEWEEGLVTAVDSWGRPHVCKDGWDESFLWGPCGDAFSRREWAARTPPVFTREPHQHRPNRGADHTIYFFLFFRIYYLSTFIETCF